MWGGPGNAILTMPAREDVGHFVRALRRFDPDLILTTSEVVPSFIGEAIAKMPCPWEIINESSISEFVDGINPLLTSIGALPYLGNALRHLFPSPVPESNVRYLIYRDGDTLAWGLLYGIPNEAMQLSMSRYFGAKRYRVPQDPEEVVWTSILSQHRSSLLGLAKHRTRIDFSRNPFDEQDLPLLEQGRVDSSTALNLFLAGEEDLGVLTAFWNAQRTSLSKNNYLFPVSCVVDAGDLILQALLSVHRCDMLHIFTALPVHEAERMQHLIKQMIQTMGLSIPVLVLYAGFQFSMSLGRLTWEVEHTITRGIAPDGLLRFSVPVQLPLSGDGIAGYDAVVELGNGSHLTIEPSGIGAVLLLNSKERIDKARSNDQGLGRYWLRARRVRPRLKGIAGVSKAGEELGIYLHPDEFIIEQTLRERGYVVKPNQHTRYASGFVRRFGGFDKTMSLVRGGAVAILEALGSQRATQSGLFSDQIRSILERELGMAPAQSKAALKQFLPEMLSTGIVRRGLALRCSHCDLEEWYAIDSISETVVCAGCLSTFQLQGEGPRYKYVANELARRFITTGGHAVLQTAAVLQLIDTSGQTQFGGDLRRVGEEPVIAEVDVIRIIGDVLIFAECKAYRVVREQELVQIKESLTRTIRAARALEAHVVILGLVTAAEDLRDLYATLEPMAEAADTQGIGLHLIVNDKFHPYGGANTVDPGRIDVPRLNPRYERAPVELTFGEMAGGYGFGGLEALGQDVLADWDLKLAQLVGEE